MFGLILTFIAGSSFYVGKYINKVIKNQNKLYSLSLGLCVTTLLGIIIFDLIPEIKESIVHFKFGYFYVLLFLVFGFLMMFLIDKLIPSHEHIHHTHEKNIKEHNNHIFHISILTCIGMMIHNYLEGMSLYIISFASFFSGIIMCLSIMCHNIPIGIQVSLSKKNKKLLLLLLFSTFLGGLTVCLFNFVITNNIMVCLLSLTVGMTLYLIIFEYLKEIKNYNKQNIIKGILIGIIIILLNLLID